MATTTSPSRFGPGSTVWVHHRGRVTRRRRGHGALFQVSVTARVCRKSGASGPQMRPDAEFAPPGGGTSVALRVHVSKRHL